MPQLLDKVVVVTGAAHGIGRAYARDCASRGARVSLWDIDGAVVREVAAEIRASGGTCLGLTVDVTDAASISAAIRETAKRLGEVSGLVNNAGMLNRVPISRVTFEHIPDDEWDRAFLLNTKSVWLCCKGVVGSMRSVGGGSIINIASSTVFLANPTRAHYVASKAAVIGLSRVLARELGADNIRVNVVCPGSTLSEEDPTPEMVAMRRAPIAGRALKRIQLPEDVTGTVAFLLSDDSAFMTGQTLVVEGGGVVH